MSYKLETSIGTLELPSISCCYCLFRMQFWACSSCRLVNGFYNATKPILDEIDRMINEDNNEEQEVMKD